MSLDSKCAWKRKRDPSEALQSGTGLSCIVAGTFIPIYHKTQTQLWLECKGWWQIFESARVRRRLQGCFFDRVVFWRLGSGQEKFSTIKLIFSILYPVGSKNLFRLGRSMRESELGFCLIYCGSEVCLGQFRLANSKRMWDCKKGRLKGGAVILGSGSDPPISSVGSGSRRILIWFGSGQVLFLMFGSGQPPLDLENFPKDLNFYLRIKKNLIGPCQKIPRWVGKFCTYLL